MRNPVLRRRALSAIAPVIAIVAFVLMAAGAPGLASASHNQQEIQACLAAKAEASERIVICGRALKARHLYGPDLRKVYLARGNAYLALNEFEQAINDFDAALRLGRRDPQAYFARGRALAGRGSYDHAFADFSQAIKLSPKLYRAYFERGASQIWRREFDAAINDYTVAIKNIPALSEALGNRGWARILKEQFSEAAADFEAESKARGRPIARLWRYLALARGGGADGKAALDLAASAIKPGDWPWPIVQLFQGTLTAEDLVRASRASDLAVEERQRCEAFFYDAQRRLIAKDRAGAAEGFQQAKAICPAQSFELVVAWAEFDAVASTADNNPQ